MTFKRRQLFINPEVQGMLIKRNIMYWCIGFLALIVSVMVWNLCSGSSSNLTEAFQASWAQNIPVVLLSLVLMPIFVYDSLKTSNRVAGPLFRLKREMQKLSEANYDKQSLQPLKFRDGDFWEELAGEFNRIIRRVRSQDDRLKEYFKKAPEILPESVMCEEVVHS